MGKLKSDFVLLKGIVTELLDNALEFGDTEQQKIDLHFREDNVIRVTSYGTPIPESFTQKMFYPFFSNKARGVGLGLSKCVRYAHELGYRIVLSQNSSVHGISFDIQMN
jgi:C4-dicarboxylate-specific signal transduction histidine kinase